MGRSLPGLVLRTSPPSSLPFCTFFTFCQVPLAGGCFSLAQVAGKCRGTVATRPGIRRVLWTRRLPGPGLLRRSLAACHIPPGYARMPASPSCSAPCPDSGCTTLPAVYMMSVLRCVHRSTDRATEHRALACPGPRVGGPIRPASREAVLPRRPFARRALVLSYNKWTTIG